MVKDLSEKQSVEVLGRDAAPWPLLCLEVNPPRGTQVDDILKRLDGKVSAVDFFNVTDCALAKMKMSAVAFAAILKQRFGVEPLVNMTCRDRNLIAIQADLLGGWALGVRSVVAITGDAITTGDSPDRKSVFEVNSIGLLNAIRTMNMGKDLAGNNLKGAPGFVAGVVVNPNAKNPEIEVRRLARKKEAGACYALSQPVFEEEQAIRFFEKAKEVGMPILMGLLPLRTIHSARAIAKVPGIRLSRALDELVKGPEDQDLSAFSMEHCLSLAKATSKLVGGFHIISASSPVLAIDLVARLSTEFREAL